MPSNVPPINLSQVSKGWRQIALSQPFLWSFVRIDAITNEDLRRALSRVETWLQRSVSSSAPLTLDIRIPAYDGEEAKEVNPCEDVDSIFQELDRHKGRWKDVTIHSYCPEATLPTLENLPMLQKLDYLESLPVDVAITPRRRVDLSTIPLLRQFTATGFLDLLQVPSNAVLSDLTIVHLRITDHIHFPKVKDCLVIFRCAPRLEEFHVEIGQVGPPDVTADCILLANLNSLCIYWMFSHSSAASLRLLNSIKAPSLRTLSVNFYELENEEAEAIAILHNFISHCNISLVNLCISTNRYDLDIVSVLQLSPELVQLTLCCHQIPEAVCAGLSENIVDEDGRVEFTLCPRLASIFLISAQWRTEEEEAICGIQPMMDVISCRWNIPASQRSLKVASINWLPAEAAPELNKMTLEGLDLRS